MAIIVGIDEAGYGPLLGPLVVSAVAFRVPDDKLRSNLWETLINAVSSEKKGLSGRLLITDSKKAYSRSTGISHLRKTVLSSLNCLKTPLSHPDNASGLIELLDPECADRLTTYPWYQHLSDKQLGHDQSDIQIAGSVLEKALAENHMKLLAIQSKCLDVGFYNNRVKLVKNKSRVLFTELCSLVLSILKNMSDSTQTVQVVVDRQGGRINYQTELLRMFPGFSLKVIRQDAAMSSYELSNSQHRMKIHFCMKADAKFLPVSLASMVSKYLREVLVEMLNDYFCLRCDNLKPTAGYWQDGQRFIKDIEKKLPNHPLNRDILIRIS